MSSGAVSRDTQLRLRLSDPTNPLRATVDEGYFDQIREAFAPAIPTPVFAIYWHFAAERQAIFFRRIEGQQPPWTIDEILNRFRFTNVYRASDRVSQYLIRSVIYDGDQSPREIFFRTLLFKVFNRVETWEMLKRNFGEVSYNDYSYERYDNVFSDALASGHGLFSAAYIMPSGVGQFANQRKHRNYLRLLEKMIADSVPERLSSFADFRSVVELLRSYPLLGNFLAYQYAIDINYSSLTCFSENDFVLAGPGAKSGIRKCFSSTGGLADEEIIRMMVEHQDAEFQRLQIEFRNLWGRKLHLIDCQNVFCEVDKYTRVAHPELRGPNQRTRIKRLYQPSPQPLCYWYPPKWGMNHSIDAAHRGDGI